VLLGYAQLGFSGSEQVSELLFRVSRLWPEIYTRALVIFSFSIYFSGTL
jgi:hypothetical protein